MGLRAWAKRKVLMMGIKNLLTLKALKGWRTKIIGGGMILSGLGTIAAHVASVIGGEALNWDTLQAAGVMIATGAGLLTAAAHQPTPE